MSAVLTLAVTVVFLNSRSASPEPLRFSVAIPGRLTQPLFMAISPDGQHLAFVVTDSAGKSMLWIRDFNQLEPRVVPGTEDAAHPFWSPDSHSIGFFSSGKLKRVEAAGGPVATLAQPAARSGGAWNQDGTILFIPDAQSNLAKVSVSGGAVSPVVVHDSSGKSISVSWPRF